ncbi:DnaJ-like protein subfamily A member 5 [Geosmithia morbida]|uniref:DnaJ-like protein subfamily A member 5 n=1 Tax=Geosmithia morbida TaxID=1094350 RepID=A0A9P4YR53_9HYPO|nr:DnaJ-like protein subfamily A member 5 [Geosmithia morbida]KAF4121581.1 DnaJ-like protein subfamily A member 5 [Geosmithia morbida]
MGAQQSSSTGQEEASNPSLSRTCYYELLAVDRQASDEEIKKAYRRKALELHPDRNIDNVAIATQRFAEVQTAYEVLSDPQERAWYDSHRESILQGGDGLDQDDQPATFRNVRLTSTEEIHNLMRRFNPTIPFTDDPSGFYGIARETFEHLVLEEEAAADMNDRDLPNYPTFGSSNDDYDSVVKPFYNVWAGFSTRKTFSWKDKYRLSDAPDRRVRRLMEKDNKKTREDAIRDFNDAVRFLVTFVRKRDPRYLPNTQTHEERQKTMRFAAASQAAKARAANREKLATYEVPTWAQSQGSDAGEVYFQSDEEHADKEEEEMEILECVVCDKSFKSEKQLQVHEKSKKHKKAVQQLQWKMRKEGAELNLDTGRSEHQGPKVSTDEKEEKGEDEGVSPDLTPEDSKDGHTGESPSNIEDKETLPDPGEDADHSSEDDEYAPRSIVQSRLVLKELSSDGGDDNAHDDLAAATENVTIDDTTAPKRIGKAKAKREKKASKAAQKGADTMQEGHAAPVAKSKRK